MPWRPLPRIAFAVAVYPFQPASPADLPLELGDELYIIEQGGNNGEWYRGYLVAPPSLLAGLTSVKGQTLEARVFSGIFPKCCVEIREELGEVDLQKSPMANGETTPTQSTKDDAYSIAGSEHRKEEVGSQNLKGLGLQKDKRQSLLKDNRYSSTSRGLAWRSSMSSRLSVQSAIKTSTIPSTPTVNETPIGKPQAPVPMLKIGDETPTSASEPLVDEIASCLREWQSTNLHGLLLNRQYGTLEQMTIIVSQLDYARRQLLNDVLTAQERLALREQAVWNLVKGNKMLNGEVIIRDPAHRGRLLTGDDSAIELSRLQSVMSLLETGPTASSEAKSLHHLLLELKSVTGSNPEAMTVEFSLLRKSISIVGNFAPLSETFTVEVPSTESFANVARSNKLKTLFTDLSGQDIGETSGPEERLYVVVKVLASEMPKMPSSPEPESLSRNGTLKSINAERNRDESLKRRRGSLIFGSVRKPGFERVKQFGTGRQTPQPEDRAPSPINKVDEPMFKPKPQPVARVVGVGLVEVGELLKRGVEEECFLAIWSPAEEGEEEEGEHDMDHAIPKFLYSPTGRYVRSSRASRIHLQLSPFAAADPETLIKTNPTTMHMVNQAQKLGFSEAPSKPRSDIYVTFHQTSIVRGARLSHPEAGFVPIPVETLYNLQLTMEVRDIYGKRIDNCIFPSSNSPGVTAWRTTASELGSTWGQTICLRLPTEQVSDAHLIMSIADAPDFPFALAWMPLWDQKAFIHDGSHNLIMHAYDKSTSTMINGKGAYLSLPWNTDDESFMAGHDGVMATVATLQITSCLCSTEYSQDPVVIGLINWKSQPSVKLLELLKQLIFIPELEIVKQLNNILDSLFAILVHKSGETKYEDQIFIDLVTVLGYVHDRRFNLGPLVDQYAESHFESPFAATSLVRSFTRLLQSVADSESSRTLRALFKVGRQIIKLIITSHQQQKFNSVSSGVLKTNSSFKEDMQSIFFGLQMMMRSETAALIGSKTLLVQHFHSWLPELLAAFTKEEVMRIAVNFVEACKDVKGKLVLYKLVMILNYAQLDELWSEAEDRQILFKNCQRWLAPYWGERHGSMDQWYEQVRLCCSVVSQLVQRPMPVLYDFMPKIADSYRAISGTPATEKKSLSLLFPKTYPFISKPSDTPDLYDEALMELAALMSTISTAAPPHPKSMGGVQDSELAGYIVSVMEVQKSLLEGEAYPETWLSLNIYHHRSAMKILEYVSGILRQSFLPDAENAEQFQMELWRAFFMTLLKLVGSETLALETFPEQKRRVVWKIAGDVREMGAELLRQTWDSIGWESSTDDLRRYNLKRLGGYQVQYVPSLVAPIVELCLSVHEGLRRVAVEILQTMIISEWALSEDLVLIETEMIASLDIIFKNRAVSESISQKLFIGELLDLFEPIASQPGDALWVAIKELVTTIDELMDLLVAAHSDTSETSLHTLRLMDFMKDMQKEDIFIRYVHELAREQATARNNTEAGLALQLHADLYPWDAKKIVPALANPGFPEQPASDRKEALYFQIIQHFEDGRAWAPALSLYKELADQYENTLFDLSKLARTQRSMAKINELIAKEERQNFRYFRVLYRGMGFPPTLRDKQFIFEGPSTERMAAFTDRLQKQHPSAQIVSLADDATLEGQYLEITSVTPYRDLDHPVYRRPRISPSIRDHFLVSRPSHFTTTFKKQTDGSNKMTDTRVEKIVYSTVGFPSILRKCEVLSSEVIQLSPIEVAIERTWRKTSELQSLEFRASSGDDQSNAALTSALIQLLETESVKSTSPALYRQFLPQRKEKPEKRLSDIDNDDLASENGSEETLQLRNPRQTALFVALSDHAATIKRCLTLYTRPSLQATRKDLNARFYAVYPEETRLQTPRSRGHDPDQDSRGSLSFDDIPRNERDSSIQDRSETPQTNGGRLGTGSSDQPSAKWSRNEKSSHRLSMSFLKGGAASLMPDWNQTKRNSATLGLNHLGHMHKKTESTAVSTLKSHERDVNGGSAGAVSGYAPSGYEPSPPGKVTSDQSDAAFNGNGNGNGIVKHPERLSSLPMPRGLDREEDMDDAHSDDFGRNLTNSLGASISMGRFTTSTNGGGHDDEETGRPTTAGTDQTSSSTMEVPSSEKKSRKRFSQIMRMGSKKSKDGIAAE